MYTRITISNLEFGTLSEIVCEYLGVWLNIYKIYDVRGYGAASVPVLEWDIYRLQNPFQMV